MKINLLLKFLIFLMISGVLFSSCNSSYQEPKIKKAVTYKNGSWIINVLQIIDKHFATLSNEELKKILIKAQLLLKKKLHKDIIFKLDTKFTPTVKDLIERKTQFSPAANQYKINVFNLINKNAVFNLKDKLKNLGGCKSLVNDVLLYFTFSHLKNLNCDAIIKVIIREYKKNLTEILSNKSLLINVNNFKYYSFFNWYLATSFTDIGEEKSKYNQYYLFITNAPIIIDAVFFLHPTQIKFPLLLNFGTPRPRSTIISYYPILTKENFSNKKEIVGINASESPNKIISYEITRGFGKGFFGIMGKYVKGYSGCFCEYSTNFSFAKMSNIFMDTKPCDIDLRFSDYANVSRIVNYFAKTTATNKIFKEFKRLTIKYPQSTAYQEQLALLYEEAGAKELALTSYKELINKLNTKLKSAKKIQKENNFFAKLFIKLSERDLKRFKNKVAILTKSLSYKQN